MPINKDIKNIKELFNLPDGSPEKIRVHYHLTGSQGICSAYGFIDLNINTSIEKFEDIMECEREEMVAQGGYEDYVDYDYTEDDEEYDEDEWMEADRDGFVEACCDCGKFYFDIVEEHPTYESWAFILESGQVENNKE